MPADSRAASAEATSSCRSKRSSAPPSTRAPNSTAPVATSTIRVVTRRVFPCRCTAPSIIHATPRRRWAPRSSAGAAVVRIRAPAPGAATANPASCNSTAIVSARPAPIQSSAGCRLTFANGATTTVGVACPAAGGADAAIAAAAAAASVRTRLAGAARGRRDPPRRSRARDVLSCMRPFMPSKPVAFERPCIPPDRVVRRLNMPDMRPFHALSDRRSLPAGALGVRRRPPVAPRGVPPRAAGRARLPAPSSRRTRLAALARQGAATRTRTRRATGSPVASGPAPRGLRPSRTAAPTTPAATPTCRSRRSGAERPVACRRLGRQCEHRRTGQAGESRHAGPFYTDTHPRAEGARQIVRTCQAARARPSAR